MTKERVKIWSLKECLSPKCLVELLYDWIVLTDSWSISRILFPFKLQEREERVRKKNETSIMNLFGRLIWTWRLIHSSKRRFPSQTCGPRRWEKDSVMRLVEFFKHQHAIQVELKLSTGLAQRMTPASQGSWKVGRLRSNDPDQERQAVSQRVTDICCPCFMVIWNARHKLSLIDATNGIWFCLA